MAITPQNRAIKRYRKRLNDKGLARFEVLGRDTDRELIRCVAKRLSVNDAGSAQLRATIRDAVNTEQPKKGFILEALRRSPMVGADLDLRRPWTSSRKVDL